MSGNGEHQDDGGTEDRETLLRKERELGLPAQQIFSIFFNQLYQVTIFAVFTSNLILYVVLSTTIYL